MRIVLKSDTKKIDTNLGDGGEHFFYFCHPAAPELNRTNRTVETIIGIIRATFMLFSLRCVTSWNLSWCIN